MLKTNTLLLHVILDGYPVSLGGYCYELCSLYVGGEDHGASSSALMEKAHGMFIFSNVLSVLALVLMCCSRTFNQFRSIYTYSGYKNHTPLLK